jgi:DNA topoisomerase-1
LDEDQQPQVIDSSDVNGYLRDIAGQDFTAKDFRTCWNASGGSGTCGREGRDFQGADKENVLAAIKVVAEQLRNTPAICRKSYIHPIVLEAYSDGYLAQLPDSIWQSHPDHLDWNRCCYACFAGASQLRIQQKRFPETC